MATEIFAKVPEWLLDADVSDRAVRLFALLERCGKEAYPSRTTLSARLRCSRDAVDRAMKELEKVKAVKKVPRFDKAGDRTTNLYDVAAALRLGGRDDAATPPQESGDGGLTLAATGGRTGAAQNESNFEREQLNDTARADALVLRYIDDVVKASTNIRNLPAFKRTIRKEHEASIRRLVDELSDLSDDEILRRHDPDRYPASSAPRSFCHECHGVTFVDTDEGAIPCPRCRPASTNGHEPVRAVG